VVATFDAILLSVSSSPNEAKGPSAPTAQISGAPVVRSSYRAASRSYLSGRIRYCPVNVKTILSMSSRFNVTLWLSSLFSFSLLDPFLRLAWSWWRKSALSPS